MSQNSENENLSDEDEKKSSISMDLNPVGRIIN